jgi:hypothetical protein
MRAAVLHGPRKLSIERVFVPQLAPNEVLVAVDAVGLCGSDVHCYTGERPMEYPMILGHEITGRIVATGTNVQAQRRGERVVVEPNILCGTCKLCTRGLGRICIRKETIGLTRWGVLADYVAVPDHFTWSIPETFTLRDAVTIEPTTVATHALSRAQVEPGATIAIVGCWGSGSFARHRSNRPGLSRGSNRCNTPARRHIWASIEHPRYSCILIRVLFHTCSRVKSLVENSCQVSIPGGTERDAMDGRRTMSIRGIHLRPC